MFLQGRPWVKIIALVVITWTLHFELADATPQFGNLDRDPADPNLPTRPANMCGPEYTFNFTDVQTNRGQPDWFHVANCRGMADDLRWDPHSPRYGWTYVKHHEGLWIRMASRDDCSFHVRHDNTPGFYVGALDISRIIGNATNPANMAKIEKEGVGFLTENLMGPVHGTFRRCKSLTRGMKGYPEWANDVEWKLQTTALTPMKGPGQPEQQAWDYGAYPGDHGHGG